MVKKVKMMGGAPPLSVSHIETGGALVIMAKVLTLFIALCGLSCLHRLPTQVLSL